MTELYNILKKFATPPVPKRYTLKDYLEYLADSRFYGEIEINAIDPANNSIVFEMKFMSNSWNKNTIELLEPYQDNDVLDVYDMSYPVNPPIYIKKIKVESYHILKLIKCDNTNIERYFNTFQNNNLIVNKDNHIFDNKYNKYRDIYDIIAEMLSEKLKSTENSTICVILDTVDNSKRFLMRLLNTDAQCISDKEHFEVRIGSNRIVSCSSDYLGNIAEFTVHGFIADLSKDREKCDLILSTVLKYKKGNLNNIFVEI